MTATSGPPPSRWRPSPGRAARLLLGLALFGAGEALLVAAGIGVSPWTVLAEGLAERTGLSIGSLTIIVGVAVLALWIPLRQRPGLGTIANALLVGVALDLTLRIAPTPHHVVLQVLLVLAGIALVGLGSGFYLGTGLGPGPRDGLMTGLHRVTGRSLRLARFAVEGTVLVAGALLGGTVGIGTVLFAVLIGPAVAAAVAALTLVPATRL